MDERKNFKRPHPKAASLDGFVSDGRQLGAPLARSYQPNREAPTPVLGIYQTGVDGFNPIRQAPRDISHTPEATEAEALLNEPIILEEDHTKKKKKARKHPRARGRLKRSVVVLLSLIFLFAGYFGVKLYLTERHLFHGGGGAPALAKNVDINQLKGEGDGRVNILLLGIGGPTHQGGDLTDSMMLVSIDPVNHKMALLSVPRDLWVKIPGDGQQKINAAYSYGKEGSRQKSASAQQADGLNLLDQTLESVIGVPIHYHAIVDFKAFQQGVDAVGGVDATVPASLTARENFWVEGTRRFYYLNVPAGKQHFDGTKALYYARERHNDSDFARSERQRLLFSALKEKALSLDTFSNPVKISNLLDSFGNNVYTDFSLNDITRLQQIMSKIPSGSISSLDFTTPPHNLVTTGNINGLSVVEPRAGLFDYSAIQYFVHNALKDSYLAKENSHIAIYNATTINGLAGASADKLRSFGYNVTIVDNTPSATNPSITTIVDLSKGADKYTRHYLEQRFKVKAVTSMPKNTGVSPPSGTTFVIILGRDAANSSKTSFAN
jgi:LCP family protein required for cell wall assembly